MLQAIPRKPAEFAIRFAPESVEIAPGSRADVAAAIEAARTTADPQISVVAHSDATSVSVEHRALMLQRTRFIAGTIVPSTSGQSAGP